MTAYELNCRLGPFYDDDGSEFIPVGFEESVERLAQAVGEYTVVSKIPELHGACFTIDDHELTMFIQEDWNQVTDEDFKSPRGFLLAARAGAYAAGRVAEEVILRRLFSGATLFNSSVERVICFWQATDSGLVKRPKGIGSDDLILQLKDGRLAAVESKATFKGTLYLRRSLPKVEKQLKATLEANDNISLVVACLIDLIRHTVIVASTDRRVFLAEGLSWPTSIAI